MSSPLEDEACAGGVPTNEPPTFDLRDFGEMDSSDEDDDFLGFGRMDSLRDFGRMDSSCLDDDDPVSGTSGTLETPCSDDVDPPTASTSSSSKDRAVPSASEPNSNGTPMQTSPAKSSEHEPTTWLSKGWAIYQIAAGSWMAICPTSNSSTSTSSSCSSSSNNNNNNTNNSNNNSNNNNNAENSEDNAEKCQGPGTKCVGEASKSEGLKHERTGFADRKSPQSEEVLRALCELIIRSRANPITGSKEDSAGPIVDGIAFVLDNITSELANLAERASTLPSKANVTRVNLLELMDLFRELCSATPQDLSELDLDTWVIPTPMDGYHFAVASDEDWTLVMP